MLLAPSVETPHGKQCGRGPDRWWCDCTNFTLPLAHVLVLFAVRPSFQWGRQSWKCMMWPKGLNNVRRKAGASVYIYTWVSRGWPSQQSPDTHCLLHPIYSLALVVLSYRLKSCFSAPNGGCVRLSTIYSVFFYYFTKPLLRLSIFFLCRMGAVIASLKNETKQSMSAWKYVKSHVYKEMY